jgi:hypothetical protein
LASPQSEPAIAPAHQGGEHRIEVDAHLGEPVLVAIRRLLVAVLLEHAPLDQRREPVGEDVACDAEVALDLLEAAQAHEDVAQDQGGPPLADDVEGAGDRARQVAHAGALHGPRAYCIVAESISTGNSLGESGSLDRL